jgi:hypothetical protein
MRTTVLSLVAAAFFGLSVAGVAGVALAESPWPSNARVYFIEPADGSVVAGKVTVKFGLSGLGLAPAGVEKANTGHHHLLVDTDAPTVAKLAEPLPVDAHSRHFGGGQTETRAGFAAWASHVATHCRRRQSYSARSATHIAKDRNRCEIGLFIRYLPAWMDRELTSVKTIRLPLLTRVWFDLVVRRPKLTV